VYVHQNELYRQVKKKGNVIYLKCNIDISDGSAKMANGQFTTLVRRPIEYFLLLVIGRIHGRSSRQPVGAILAAIVVAPIASWFID